MSGGYFDYKQYEIDAIIDSINRLIENNGSDIVDEMNMDVKKYQNYDKQTIKMFKEAVNLLSMGSIFAQRIDWLVSGDDSEDSFHARLLDDIDEYYTKVSKQENI